jgi:hypothetical protein
MIKEAQFQKLVESYDHSLLEKLAGIDGVVKSFFNFGKEHPAIAAAVPALGVGLGAGYFAGIKSKKGPEINYLTRANVAKALSNSNFSSYK